MRILIAATIWFFTLLPFSLAGMYDFCLTLKNQDEKLACVDAWARDREQARQEQQLRQLEAAQAEYAARQQALGLALFGSGAAAIQGMNQGLQGIGHSTDWMKNPNLAPPVGTK
jgi:hypothetical protein